jgi:ethanolamine utilization cobalamin adenosyltransferase
MTTKKTATTKTASKATSKKAAPKSEAKTKTTSVTKPAKEKKAKATSDKPKKMSALDAAAKVLGESSEPMATKAMIDAMAAKGYWTSPGGQTPSATLYAAIIREISVKGAEARFKKTDRGLFAIK